MGSTEIVVHAVSPEDVPEGQKACLYGELYRVNLDTGEISKCPGGKLYFDDELTSMAISGGVIYIVGGGSDAEEDEDYHEYVKDKHPQHSRVSCIDLISDDPQWKPLPECVTPFTTVPAATYKGNLFAFGGNFQEEFCSQSISEFHAEKLVLPLKPLDTWRLLLQRPPPPPPEVIQCSKAINVSTPVLVDSKNDRILVHFPIIGSLYALYPDRLPRWDFLFCIGWSPVVGVFDDIILFNHRRNFQAFDLQNDGKELHDLVISADFPSHVLDFEFDALIPLSPPGTFCLAVCHPQFKLPDITRLVFAKFRVERQTSGQIHIIYISHYTLNLDCKARVTNYVPIDDVVSSKLGKVVDSSKRDKVVDSSKKGDVSPSKIGDWVTMAFLGVLGLFVLKDAVSSNK